VSESNLCKTFGNARGNGGICCACRSSGITGSAAKRAVQPTNVTKIGFGVIGTIPNFGWNGKGASSNQGQRRGQRAFETNCS